MKWFEGLLHIILSFGLPGIFVLAALDSTVFFFMPFAIDLLFIAHVLHHRDSWIFYLLIAALGSVFGSFITHWIVSKTSENALGKHLPKDKFLKLKKKLDKNGFVAILLAALLPPPFPFSPFVLAASIAKMSLKKLLAAVFTGRTLRFLIEAILALLLGRQILSLLNSNGLKITMLGIFVLAVVGSAISVYKWFHKPHNRSSEP